MDVQKKKRKYIIVLVCYSVCLAAAFCFIGYQIAKRRFQQNASLRSQTFYAVITDIQDHRFTIQGLEINDINYRGAFCFSVTEETTIEWRRTAITVDDLNIGDQIAVSFAGDVLETYPAQLQSVDVIQLLDDEI